MIKRDQGRKVLVSDTLPLQSVSSTKTICVAGGSLSTAARWPGFRAGTSRRICEFGTVPPLRDLQLTGSAAISDEL